MNKKFLSAILFGALMVTSTGTFVSCKDYDDDIENLQGQISANASAIAELKALIGDGNYVTSVTVSGQNLVVNTKNGSTTVALPECEDEVGSICTISEEGELLIDGKATGIKVAEQAEDAEFLPAIEIVDGEWAVLQEDGTYKSTGVAVSSVAVTGDEKNGYVLTVVDAEGAATTIKLPTAASLITSITVAPTEAQDDPSADYAVFNLAQAKFTKPSSWGGKKALPSNGSIVYSPTNNLYIRVNPVDAPAQDATFYLTNTKNQTLSQIALTASTTQQSWNDPIGIGGINGRSVSNNGLWTLGMDQYILDADAAAAFKKELGDKGVAVDAEAENSAAFAVNANDEARSAYNVAVSTSKANELRTIRVKNYKGEYSVATLGGKKPNLTVNVGTVNKVLEGEGEGGLMYDMYFSAASETVVETYGLVFDHLNRTFTVTKRPDVVTSATSFDLVVTTLDIWGNIKTATYNVKLSANVGATLEYAAVEHDLAKLADGKNNDYFIAAISEMKAALGDNWSYWANNVKLSNTAVTLHKKADLSDAGVAVTGSSTHGLKYYLLDGDSNTTTDPNDVKYIYFSVGDGDETLTIDTQYYAKVAFYGLKKDSYDQLINYVVIPVTFVAPTVAEQFTLKSGYVVEDVINAYYYDYESKALADRKSVELKHYFDAADADAVLSLDTDAAVVSRSNGEPFNSARLAKLSTTAIGTAKIKLTEGTIAGPWGGSLSQDADTKTEVGYGKDLIVEAWNEDYKGWLYENDTQKAYSFTIKLMSPIYEGNITPVSGSTINVTANAEKGFAITKSMIELTDYNSNLYCVVPDKEGTTNNENGGTDVWSAAQINDVWVTKAANNTYIKEFAMQAYIEDADGEVTQEGAIIVKADPLPNSQETSMFVNVKDCWGYLKAQEVSVTIVKQ